jgi:putative oxidoreductase
MEERAALKPKIVGSEELTRPWNPFSPLRAMQMRPARNVIASSPEVSIMASANPPLRRPGDPDDVLARARAEVTVPPRSSLLRLVHTDDALAPAFARLGLGLVMLPHALQKAFGWFGGSGFSATYGAFTRYLGIPAPLAFLAIVTEITCSLMLLFGVLTRIAAAGMIAVMLGAIAYVNGPNGFFMNWMGHKAGEGFEFHLLAIALGLVALLLGGGRASVDRAIMTRRPMNGGSIDTRLVTP